MKRNPNTNKYGQPWSLEIRALVWQKARKIEGVNPNFIRLDACGTVIEWKMFGKTLGHSTGWEIDHITPVAESGGDELANLQPLQWQNNRAKDKDPYCGITVIT
ncbi:HNH endonuclease [Zhouia spongiae]|uniref:HNH endonuclease n=1 Tax=Zhouia spongiae TaxID=2202721 RepID=A0ABY3YLT6_9FLAO|nr:HNH endonuclease signature motif containing protein [Zhouia spongiae]UNY98451.1 HNH endonuclease [Zhouia spongiae]